MGKVSEIKLLGLHWQFTTINLTYRCNNSIIKNKITKRTILSKIAKTFDPSGLFVPAITMIKILLQVLWSLKLECDKDVPTYIKTKW